MSLIWLVNCAIDRFAASVYYASDGYKRIASTELKTLTDRICEFSKKNESHLVS